MSKLYEVKKINDEHFTYLIIANSCRSPLEVLDEISAEIECEHCTILIDMLLRTGLSYNRYLSIDFVEDKFDLKTIRVVDSDVNNTIKSIAIELLNNNLECVEKSILPAPLKFLIKKKQLV